MNVAQEGAAVAARTRAMQGLPAKITDEDTLRRVASLVRSATKKTAEPRRGDAA